MLLERSMKLLQSYLLPPSIYHMTSTPLIHQDVSKLPAHTHVISFWSDCTRVRRHILTLVCEKELLSVTAQHVTCISLCIHLWSGFLSKWFRVALSAASERMDRVQKQTNSSVMSTVRTLWCKSWGMQRKTGPLSLCSCHALSYRFSLLSIIFVIMLSLGVTECALRAPLL
jgi:hypothetical protein